MNDTISHEPSKGLNLRHTAIEQRLAELEAVLRPEPTDYLTAHGFAWEQGLPDASILPLIRLAGRFSHESGTPIGYQYDPDLVGEGLTFRRDLLMRAAQLLETSNQR